MINQIDESADAPDFEHNFRLIPKERRKEWAFIIAECYTILMRPVPTGNQLKFTIYAFDKVCRSIPTDRLRETYYESLRLKSADGGVPYWDVRMMASIWDMRLKQLKDFNIEDVTPSDCPKCFGVGVEIVKTDYGTAGRRCTLCNVIKQTEACNQTNRSV
jgi:hypothetical protein